MEERELAELDLIVRIGTSEHKGECRFELRVKSTDAFVAWFQSVLRVSNGEEVLSTSAQLVRRKELTTEQCNAARKWLHYRMSTAI